MELYKNTKAMVHSSNGDTDFFDITPEVLQGDTLIPYLFIISLIYVLQTPVDLIKGNSLILKKARNR